MTANKDSLSHLESIELESEHIVWEHNDFVVSPLVEFDKELTSTELIGIGHEEKLKQNIKH